MNEERNETRESTKKNESLVFNLIPVTLTLILDSVSQLLYYQTQMYSRMNEPPVILVCLKVSPDFAPSLRCDQDISCCNFDWFFDFWVLRFSFERETLNVTSSSSFSIVFRIFSEKSVRSLDFPTKSCVMLSCLLKVSSHISFFVMRDFESDVLLTLAFITSI